MFSPITQAYIFKKRQAKGREDMKRRDKMESKKYRIIIKINGKQFKVIKDISTQTDEVSCIDFETHAEAICFCRNLQNDINLLGKGLKVEGDITYSLMPRYKREGIDVEWQHIKTFDKWFIEDWHKTLNKMMEIAAPLK